MPIDPTTGRIQLNAQLVEGAKGLLGPAASLASGASLLQTATGVLKGAALDKLLGPTAIFAGGLIGVLTTIRSIVRQSQILEKGLANIANLQQIEGKFTTLLKSAELAKKRIQELYQFTANSPFRFTDVAEANRTLQALTNGAYSSAEAMRTIGDAAAATGQDFSDLAEKVGKLYAFLASGRSIERVAFGLQFTGIATDGLAAKLEALEGAGASFSEKWAEVTKVLKMNEGGMKDEMKTLGALQTKLDEAGAMMAQAFSLPFVAAQSKSIETMTKATENLTPVLKGVGSDLAKVSGLVTDFKSGLIENTLATSGFATALQAAWEIGKGLFITLTALTGINALRGLGGAGAFLKRSATTGAQAVKAGLGGAGATAAQTLAATKAEVAGVVAKQALSNWNLTLAATEGVLALRLQVVARAMAIQKVYLEAATGATRIAAITNGVLGASSAVVAGGMQVVGKVAVGTGRAIAGAFTAAILNPIGITVGLIVALGTAFFALKSSADAATEQLDRTAKASEDLNRELDRVQRAFSNTDEWAANMQRVVQEIVKAEKATADFKKQMADRSTFQKFKDAVGERMGLGTESRQKETVDELQRQQAALDRRKTENLRIIPNLGMGAKESEDYIKNLQTKKETDDSAFNNRLGLAGDREAVKLIREKTAEMDRLNIAAEKVRDSQNKFDRDPVHLNQQIDHGLATGRLTAAQERASDGGLKLTPETDLVKLHGELTKAAGVADKSSLTLTDSELADERAAQAARKITKEQVGLVMDVYKATKEVEAAEKALAATRNAAEAPQQQHNNQRILDLQKFIQTTKDAQLVAGAQMQIADLQKQNLGIQNRVGNLDATKAQSVDLTREATARENRANIADVEQGFDSKIATATGRGNVVEVQRLEYLKQIAVIEEQIRQAKLLGADGATEAKRLATAKKIIAAEKQGGDKRFADERAIIRFRDQALAEGRGLDAQAAEDVSARKAMVEEYTQNGLTEAEADSDFDLSIKARRRETPRVSVDSLQAVGLGGHSSNTPTDYSRQTADATNEIKRILKRIEDKGGSKLVIQ